jgi:hypothetical protein
MYRDNALALLLTAVEQYRAEGVTPASSSYDAEATKLRAQLRDTRLEDLRVE